jgi:phthiodiolone/phenolphthiodiolone dimycocerosates ketoreductase
MPVKVGAPGAINPPVDVVLRTAKRNEEKGYDSLWYPDHWMAWHPESIWTEDITPIAKFQKNPHVYLDPVATMAAVGVVTERVQLGTCVTEPVRRHPAMLANEWLTLDHITKGRVILGLGSGEAENNEPYGIPFEKTVSKFEEAITIIKLLWANDEPIDFDGQFWTMRDAVNGMQPYTPGKPPPIWTGAHGPRMCRITGRLADGWLPSLLTVDEYKEKLGIIHESAAKAGRDLSDFEAGMWNYAIVDADHEECHRILEAPLLKAYMLVLAAEQYTKRGMTHPFGDDFHGLSDYIPTRYGRDETLKAIDQVPFELIHELMPHGTPDELVAIARDYEAAGAQHIMLWNVTFLGDFTKVGESFHLMDDVLAGIKGTA